MATTDCPTCAQFARTVPGLKCNRHRVESMSAALVRRAREAGYQGTDPREAEQFLGARPIVVN